MRPPVIESRFHIVITVRNVAPLVGWPKVARSSAQGSRIQARKSEHMDIVLHEPSSSSAGWDDIDLVHDALPDVDLAEIDLSTEFLGGSLRVPLIVSGMTGGHPDATTINARLARAAQRHQIGLGVGSQRAALVDEDLVPTYAITRMEAPDAFLIGNLGVSQLVDQPDRAALGASDVLRAIDMIDANAIAIHLNFLEELVQPEGERNAQGCAPALEGLSTRLSLPILAKETGAGLSRATAQRLAGMGMAGLDVGGSGGTNFARIESVRAERRHDVRRMQIGSTFGSWGIPTPVSVLGARVTDLPLVATGGVRSGLDAAKALALGATAVGVGRPMLAAAMDGDQAVDAWLEQFQDELRAAVWLTGCQRPTELSSRPLVVGGRTRQWLDDLGYRLEDRK